MLPLASYSLSDWPLSVVTVTRKLPVPETPLGRVKPNVRELVAPAARLLLPLTEPEATKVRVLLAPTFCTRTESVKELLTAALPTFLSSQPTVTWEPDCGLAGCCTARFSTVRSA